MALAEEEPVRVFQGARQEVAVDRDGIIDAIVENLELERELGVFELEVDRSLLAEPVAQPSAAPAAAPEPPPVVMPERPRKAGAPAPRKADIVFVHEKPLSAAAQEFMAKARGGLGVAEDAAPLACSAPLPPARVYVFLGSAALRAFAPGLKAGMGELVTSPGGRRAIVTYSPEQMVRFASSPAVQKMKALTWKSFKAAAAEASKAESSKEEGK